MSALHVGQDCMTMLEGNTLFHAASARFIGHLDGTHIRMSKDPGHQHRQYRNARFITATQVGETRLS
jgi:hypothetical protein